MDGWRLIVDQDDPAVRLAAMALTVTAAQARADMDPWVDTTKGG